MWKTEIKMNDDGGYKENVESDDSIGEIIGEYRSAYENLSPEERFEADVQRAFKLIDLGMNTESLSPELRLRFAEWFAESADYDYVGEAFWRYINQEQEVLNWDPQGDKKMFDDFFEKKMKKHREKNDASLMTI